MIIDFHSHILPEIDDGSKSIEESAEMLRMMKAQGVDTVVATPHFYASHDDLDRFLARRQAAKERVDGILTNEMPKLLMGAEVAYFPGMSQSKALQQLTIEGTNAILIELPMTKWTDTIYRELTRIYEYQRLIPIVAHVDRYLTPLRSFGIPKKLEELPVIVQANADFFLEKATARKALKMLAADQIHLLGSDTHNLTSRRPNLGEALAVIEKHQGSSAIEQIVGWQEKILVK